MENITLGQVSMAVAFIVALVGGIKYLLVDMKKIIDKALLPTNEKIEKMEKNLSEQIKRTDLNATKNFLVARIEELKSNDTVDDITRERFYEEYQHYQELGGNGFIKAEFEKLRNEGKV